MVPARMDTRVLAGAVLVFVGMLLQGIGWLSYMIFSSSYYGGSFLFGLLNGIGYILAATGFLVALLGLAQRRS